MRAHRRHSRALLRSEQLRREVARLAAAGCDDVLLFPPSGELEQVALLAEAVRGM